MIHTSQVRSWAPGEDPRILNEEHFFRSAEAFQQEAPTFFPFIGQDPEELTVEKVIEEGVSGGTPECLPVGTLHHESDE